MKLKVLQNIRQMNSAVLCMALKIQEFGKEDLCFITILKGGLYTAYGIFQNIPFKENDNTVFGCLGLSSYGDGLSSEKVVKVTYPLDLEEEHVKGKNVWVIDDVVDSGRTLFMALDIILNGCDPKTIRTAVLVDKKKNRIEHGIMEVPDVVGSTYEGSKFLVGRGLGLGEKYRGLHALYEVIEV